MYSERLLTVRETAQILGGVSAATVRSYCKKGALSTVRIGRYGWIRVKMSSVKQLLEKGMVANV
jgi:predicted site-specific integrase-resolvase